MERHIKHLCNKNFDNIKERKLNYLSLNHCVGHLKRRFSRELGLCQKVFWQEFIGSKVLLVKPKKGMIDLLRLGF